MGKCTKESSKMILSMDMAYLLGLMAENMKVFGQMGNRMELELIFWQMGIRKLEFGKMEKEWSGWIRKKLIV